MTKSAFHYFSINSRTMAFTITASGSKKKKKKKEALSMNSTISGQLLKIYAEH